MTVPGVAGDGAGLRGHCRRCERFAKSRAVGAYVGLTSRRWQLNSGRISKHGDAKPALRGRQQPADGGAPGSSTEGLGAADQEADQPQEGLRGAGAQVGGDPASHADHRRGVPLARKVNHHEERPRFRASGRDVPAGTVAEAAPLVARRTTIRECALYPGRPKPKGTIIGHDAGDDFADNRCPAETKGSEELDQRAGIRQPTGINQNPWAHFRRPIDMIFQG